MDGVKCAHEACTCGVEVGEQYCSHVCQEDATRGDIGPNACRCGHMNCERR